MIDEADLLAVTQEHPSVGLPAEGEHSESSEPRPDWARVIRDAREERSTHLLEALRTQHCETSTPRPGVSE